MCGIAGAIGRIEISPERLLEEEIEPGILKQLVISHLN